MSPVLDKKDFTFFSSFGFLIAIFMKLFDQVDLPNQMERGYLSSLFFDHIPFDSIATLLLSMIVLFLVSIAVGVSSQKMESRKKTFIHLSNRVSQLCSPAFFITLGLALGAVAIGVIAKNNGYYGYTVKFLTFSTMLAMFSYFSNALIYAFDKAHEKTPSKWAVGLGLILLIAALMQSYFNRAPMKVEVSVPLEQYELLEKRAEQRGLSVNKYIENVIAIDLSTN